ncbi:unnamed protein product [Rotaria socialis]|uniref:G-protein coupled receptors family 1 profile domain-containing protein n=1 Tax=Rotaria socialis TaxID=392032 RepID=A0A817QG17_9BILA|nr:unnamed protein product [Rotaria socialis]
MNSSSSSVSTTDLNLIQLKLARYFLVPVYILGNFGNFANIALFSQRNIRGNIFCAWYFICLSLANLFVLNTGGLSRILSLLINFNLETTSIIFCKSRNYLIQTGAVIGRYFICLISIERWMVTSTNEMIRRMTSAQIALRLIVIGPCMIALFVIHVPIGFAISNERCFASLNDTYVLFFNIYNMTIITVPVIVITLFSILIFTNVRQSRHRVVPISITGSNVQAIYLTTKSAGQQRDIQFIRLALIQIFTFMLFTIGYGIYNVYDFGTSSIEKSSDRQAIEAFISGIAVNLNYVSVAAPFFSYTLASNKFRKDCIATFHRYGTLFMRCFGE